MKRIIFLPFLFCMVCIGCVYAGNAVKTAETPPKKESRYHLYLTFDDGPVEGSEDISAVVQAGQIKINVFVIGSHIKMSSRLKSYYQLYELNPCIEIGNHSYSHANEKYLRYYSQPDKVLKDIVKNEQMLNLKNKQVRLPGRNMWRLKSKSLNDNKSGAAAADLLFKKGYSIFGWDLEWRHNERNGLLLQTVDDMMYLIEKLLRERKTFTENHLVFLCHDEMFLKDWNDIEELKELIARLRATGLYEFNHLSEYPQN